MVLAKNAKILKNKYRITGPNNRYGDCALGQYCQWC